MTRPAGTPGTAAAIEHCVAEIDAAVDDVFAGLRVLASRMEDDWRTRSEPFDPTSIATFKPHIFAELDARPVYDSAGYIMNTDAMAGGVRHLEWWHREADGRYARVDLPLDLDAPDCYDYYSMDWFVAALREQRRFADGPKIDLPCADVYVVTCTEPVVVDGMLLGTAAADVALSRFERNVLAPLRRLEAPAALVNNQRRVISSNDARWTGGEKLPAPPTVDDPAWQAVVDVTPDLGWLLAVQG